MAAPTDISLTWVGDVAGLADMFFAIIVGYTSATTIRELCKKQNWLLTGPAEYMACPGPQSQLLGREREKQRSHEAGVLFLLGS